MMGSPQECSPQVEVWYSQGMQRDWTVKLLEEVACVANPRQYLLVVQMARENSSWGYARIVRVRLA